MYMVIEYLMTITVIIVKDHDLLQDEALLLKLQ